MTTTYRFAAAVFVFLISALVTISAAARGTSKATPPATSNASGSLTLTVDCSKGQTISHALQQGDERKELVVIVRGTCYENVTINRDDVTIQGDPGSGATVNAPDASANAITVQGTRIGIVGLTVAGGLNGIAATGVPALGIQDNVIQNAARNGIQLISSHASIIRNTIQYSGNIGVNLNGASGRVLDTQIVSNSAHGVSLDGGSSLTMGGSTVSSNEAVGVWLYGNSTIVIDGCTITANGTDSTISQLERVGVSVNFSHADIRNSSITNHPYRGIVTTGTLLLGNTTVTGNGADGVALFLGAKLSMNGGTISSNNGHGVFLIGNSSGHIVGATIQSNAGSGIQLVGASMLWLSEPSSTVGGNGFYGLDCNDSESSVNDTSWLNLTPPNSLGGVGAGCTGF